MELDAYLEWLPDGAIRLKGHRIGLEHLVEHYREGYSPEEIAVAFPGLSLAAIYTTTAYYLHHQAAVDAYIAQGRTAAEQRLGADDLQPPAPVVQRLRALKAQRRPAPPSASSAHPASA